jgi:RHS repeat-associated protein
MTTNTMAYNGLDTRVSKVDSGGTRSFKRDGAYVTDPVLSDTAGGSTTKYTPGVSERRGSTSRYLHSGIKNADSRTTTGTSVEATRSYDAFGNIISATGTWQGFFGYAGGLGYQEEPDSGLKLLGHRYYDSTTGRFLSRDPIGSGRNWYSYCSNQPIRYADPSGLRGIDSVTANPGTAAWALAEIFGETSGVSALVSLKQFMAIFFGMGLVAAMIIVEVIPDPETEKPRTMIRVYRVGNPDGNYWSPTDPRTDPDHYDHYGMNKGRKTGGVISGGVVPLSEVGTRWFPRPSRDEDGNLLGNGFTEIYIPFPRTTVRNPWTIPWDPGFFR